MDPHTYFCTVEAEPLNRYCPGGYHPVHLGDFLKDGQYQILHKLGFGGYSTVWAAKDRKFQRYVAVKIPVAERKSEFRELQVLRTLSTDLSKLDGSQHIVRLLDDFQHNGPNGTHTCLVLELLGPSVQTVIEERYGGGRLPGRVAKEVSRQTLLGLGFLHQHQVGHGDIHTGNIAFTIPSLNSLSEEMLLENLRAPEIGAVTRLDGKMLELGIPEYLVWPSQFPVSKSLADISIKINDFGESFLPDNKPNALNTPLAMRAPEVIFEEDWDHRVDLWTMGCTIFELVTGQVPFDNVMIKKERLIREMIESVGDFPEKWQHKWASMKTAISTESDGYNLQQWLEVTYFDNDRTQHFTRKDIDQLGLLLRKMLRFDPSKRCAALEILQDAWFQGNGEAGDVRDPMHLFPS